MGQQHARTVAARPQAPGLEAVEFEPLSRGALIVKGALGAAAYLGQAPRIESDEVRAAALSIHAVEGRHAAALNTLTDQSFVPDGAFAKPADAATVLDSVQPFLVG